MQNLCLPLIFGSVVLLAIGCGDEASDSPALSSLVQPFQWAAAGDHDHGDMTKLALPFLRASVRDSIASANEEADDPDGPYQKLSQNHFDNCRFQESFAAITESYGSVIAAFDPALPSPAGAIAGFGLITHALQDFYAHSNWVEGGQNELVSKGLLDFPTGVFGDRIGEMVVGAPGSNLHRPANSRVPLVTIWATPTPILMTGTYASNTDSDVCPDLVQLPHGGFLAPDVFGPYDSFLAKDWPRSPHHDAALALAKLQTKEELCRLDRLVALRYGDAGRTRLQSAWIADDAGFRAACPNNDGLIASVIMAVL